MALEQLTLFPEAFLANHLATQVREKERRMQPQHNWEPPRVASGVKGRVPRLKMLGNGVVPLQILPIVAIIAMIESETVNA